MHIYYAKKQALFLENSTFLGHFVKDNKKCGGKAETIACSCGFKASFPKEYHFHAKRLSLGIIVHSFYVNKYSRLIYPGWRFPAKCEYITAKKNNSRMQTLSIDCAKQNSSNSYLPNQRMSMPFSQARMASTRWW